MNNQPSTLDRKSTIQEIERRFDGDVDRFSNLETGQAATIDAPLAMELIAEAALASSSPIDRVMDLGCGAGNNSILLRRKCNRDFECDLFDLSLPMLVRAERRLREVTQATIRKFHGDMRQFTFVTGHYDVAIAAAVLHHLRDDADWENVFAKIYDTLKPGGSVWITDLVFHESEPIHSVMWQRYGNYLESIGGAEYRDKVFEYIDKEDSPRPVTYQLELLRRVGFSRVELLHKNTCFAAFGAIK